MAPKVNCNPVRLASIVTYLQKSRTAHTIKDLEKQLPSVASISGMQVKDYLQSLQDDNKINVEKIGSGNWYWSFASEDKKVRQRALDDAEAGHQKATATNEDLRAKVAEAAAQREEEDEMLDQGGESREELTAKKSNLDAELKALRRELAAYSDNDPTELERKVDETAVLKTQTEAYSDDILNMEQWFRNQGLESEQLAALFEELYGKEFDAETCSLRELV